MENQLSKVVCDENFILFNEILDRIVNAEGVEEKDLNTIDSAEYK